MVAENGFSVCIQQTTLPNGSILMAVGNQTHGALSKNELVS